MEELVKILTERNETIAFMESCTGGFLASSLTDVEGASNVLKFSAVTYATEYKIKMGVDEEIISKYSVYSIETAREMAKNISLFASSNYGVGVTGNFSGDDRKVYVSIFQDGTYYDLVIITDNQKRNDAKRVVLEKVVEKLKKIIKN